MTHTNWDLSIPFPRIHEGKVGESFDLPNSTDLLLMLRSDRLSTENVVHETEIPRKGEYITALSLFWLNTVLSDMDTHIVAYGNDIGNYLDLDGMPKGIQRRAFVVKKLSITPVEFVWRAAMTGSLWKSYQKGEDPHRLNLPAGMHKFEEFSDWLFTPTRKSKNDPPLLSERTALRFPEETALTRKVVIRMSEFLAFRGITLIDAKFEACGSKLGDEWGSGDCTRMAYTNDFWKAQITGKDPPSLDKEPARQIASRKWAGVAHKKPLTFSNSEVEAVEACYAGGFKAITAMTLDEFWESHNC